MKIGQTRQGISIGRRISMLAGAAPQRTAIIFAPREGPERHITLLELDRASNRAARLLASRGADERSIVVVGLSNSPAHYVASIGAWKLGACVLPLSPALPAWERNQMLEAARPAVIVTDWADVSGAVVRPDDLAAATELDSELLDDRIPQPGKAIGSGGSTGRPKIIVDPRPWAWEPGGFVGAFGSRVGMRVGQVQLIAGPLYHNSPFSWGPLGLFEEHTLVVMERFDAARAVDLIERYRVNFGFLVPTMMKRIIDLPDIARRDFSSVHAFFHTAAPCPPWLKRAWIDLIGGDRLYEAYGATEAVGSTVIRGDEWLLHPGSVGLPQDCDLRILDADGGDLPRGHVGEIFMRPHAQGPTFQYLGSPPANATSDGFITVGDMGWVDDEGYLYLADRRVDLIISGGANIYPAEVEATLMQHPMVGDVAVIGLPDEDMGKRVHAIIEPADPLRPPAAEALGEHCRRRMAPYKVPASYEVVASLPRDDSGKIRRSALVKERTPA
ncbi:MAG: AMP-binding protein [Armatimonadota bacterium]